MAIRIDPYDGSIVIDGYEKGIADNPFDGIADEKNVNIISVPGEASVNFATQAKSITISTTFVVDSSDSGADTIHFAAVGLLEGGMAITFATTPTIGGINGGQTYWLGGISAGNAQLYNKPFLTGANLVDITGASGTGVVSVYNMGKPKYFQVDGANNYWMVDNLGQVWTTAVTAGANNYWVFTGNKSPSFGAYDGNGLLYFEASDGTGYLFLFNNSSIDYTKTATTVIGWNYQWQPQTSPSTPLGYAGTPSSILKTPVGTQNSHEALVSPDGAAYFVDANWIGKWYQTDPNTPFDPLTKATFTYSTFQILPTTDRAQCLAVLGNNIMIGGVLNVIYPWDGFSTKFQYPLFLAENGVYKLHTVNTNTFIFCGNRGRIYVTNGSQAQLYKKIPDHISGTVEPYFTWGGVGSTKNQLYFSALVTANASGNTEYPYYGGIWAIDMDTKAMRLVNKLSYGTYAGYASAFTPIVPGRVNPANPAGTGFYAGWQSALQSATYGVDTTISTPYTGSQTVIESDLIPIGTWQKPRQLSQVEYRLTKPMVSGESVVIKYRLDFSQAWTSLLSDSTVGNFSNSAVCGFDNAQWLQFQITLNSTGTNPSFTRLKEIRVTGIKE